MSHSAVAVVIPAKDEAERIGPTVRAASALPGVDLVVVVDDGSTDNTQAVARASGATVVRHSVNRGKASAMETGAKVVRMRDADNAPPRHLLFLDADLGDTALDVIPLIAPVAEGRVDCTIAALPPQKGAGGHGFVTGLGRRAINHFTGWNPLQPLSGQRCLSAEAFAAACPLAKGWGVEVGMTIDLLVAGKRVQEVPCNIRHRATGNNVRGYMHRLAQFRGVLRAVINRYFNSVRIPLNATKDAEQNQQDYAVYQAWEGPKKKGKNK
ncbi:glycosyltransferase [Actinotignum urinale]|uniref:Glucosyl-3-phosphoglycerate synthase n=1 Tax=Actinotignum urinale TaxID=190146 RepID=A0AAW9HW46_9ACTO|nr:glycosyltransferase [Actinotignum urinale]MDY5128537.1 glycosyltransferase [Actinotignum urinale]MDY5132628.1 glycosyltransferase [Actinotignum urinale]MDY5151281.1 glycosyltransferase [Actinotignum urinale]MDY5155099.1 glycosyltransferase [Actinotignum urinale]MDY5160626.1 glycosyltransferase [Actinotignum urinale]